MPIRRIPPHRLLAAPDIERGLGSAEAAARLQQFGHNDIVVAAPSTWLSLLGDTARDPMIWFLVCVSALFVAIGDYTEAAILAAALAPLVGMDFYLHRRTQASTRGLASRLASRAAVLRDGALITLPARDVVPGDVVEVAAGAAFPADGLVLSGGDLQVDESSLTGEAYPVRKQPLARPTPAPAAADAVHWAFAGTRLLTGSARVAIVGTGAETLYGEIVRSALTGSHARTPLQRAVGRLVGVMLVAALALCAALAAIRLMQGHGLVDALISALTLAIAALPEEFPVVLTFFLGVGVYRLARRQALVRRAVAVENIGRISCICSDKTGTLTEGRLALAHRIAAAGTSEAQLAGWAAAASRRDSGDPLDEALIAAAPQAEAFEHLAAFAFTEDRRRETAILRLPDGTLAAAMKGAPETVLALCEPVVPSTDDWLAQVASYAASGHKVIAVASKALAPSDGTTEEPSDGYRLQGLLALEDPVRDGVREAVAACRRAGIRVIMVTGDHPATAEAIARDVGLGAGHPAVALADALGLDGGDGTDEQLRNIDVVARATPAQKLHLVQRLQRAGEIVAVTGDGVNDVPALQTADIGIAMGERGTQSAREVAAVVLLDDNFRTIVGAIAEGRQLYFNLQLAFAYLLLVHIPLVLSAAAVPLADNPLLYLPIHIVWLELIIHPTAMLVFQDMPGSDRLLATPRRGSMRFFTRRTWALIVLTGLALAAVISVGFELALGAANDVEHARSMAIATLIGSSAAMTAALSRLAGWTARLVVAGSLASLFLLVQVPLLASLVHLEPLHAADWGLVAIVVTIAGALAWMVKAALERDGAAG